MVLSRHRHQYQTHQSREQTLLVLEALLLLLLMLVFLVVERAMVITYASALPRARRLESV